MKISEVSKAFDIPPETLRFIEQQGLVHPERIKDNGYRDYSLEAFSELVEYMKLRRLGLSVRSIIQLSRGQATKDLLAELEKSSQLLQKELQSKQMLYSYLEAYRHELTAMPYNIGVFSFEHRPDMLYVIGGNGVGDNYTYNDTRQVTVWRKETPYVSLGCMGDIESLRSHCWKTDWIFAAEKKYVEMLSLQDGIPLPGGLALVTYVKYRTWNDLIPICDQMTEFGQKRGFSANGKLQMIQLIKDYDSSERTGYYAKLVQPVRQSLQQL